MRATTTDAAATVRAIVAAIPDDRLRDLFTELVLARLAPRPIPVRTRSAGTPLTRPVPRPAQGGGVSWRPWNAMLLIHP